LGLFRQLHVNERLSSIIEGESLFNHGVAGSLYQAFLALVLLSLHGQAPTGLTALGNGLLLFVVEVGGGPLSPTLFAEERELAPSASDANRFILQDFFPPVHRVLSHHQLGSLIL
jgi:hypothetical protein